MQTTAAISYVCKYYVLHDKKYVGKVLGVFSFVAVVAHAVMLVAAYTYLNSSNSPVLGGLVPVLSMVVWWFMCPAADAERHHEAHSFWDQLQRFLTMLAPITASNAYAFEACAKVRALNSIDATQMSNVIGFCSLTAAFVFFGWGFDVVRRKTQNTWNFLAVVTLIMCLLECLGVVTNLVVITAVLCTLVGAGGWVFYLSHMVN